MTLLLIWLINAGTLAVLPYVLPGIGIDSFATALVTALLLGLANTVIRPILILLTLPVTLLTLGLFIFVINALVFWMVASLVSGFQVEGFWAAFWGAIAFSVISTLLSWLIVPERG